MASVTFDELAARLPGGIPEADRPRAEAALDDVETAVRHVAGLRDEDALPRVLVSITLRAARREFSNPLGVVSETVADYTWRKDGVGGMGDLLTPGERADIRRAMGYADVVSVRTPQYWSADDVSRITPVDPPGRWTSWPDGGTGP